MAPSKTVFLYYMPLGAVCQTLEHSPVKSGRMRRKIPQRKASPQAKENGNKIALKIFFGEAAIP